MDCIFCKIVAGSIPSYKIYEDEQFLVILDRFPSSVGHALILTKNHRDNVLGLTDQEASKVFVLAKKIGEVLTDTLKADGINIVTNCGKAAGQEVMHFHLHLIPRFNNDDVTMVKYTAKDPSPEEFERVQKVVTSALGDCL